MICRTLRKDAPRTVKDTPAHNALLRECRTRVERMGGKPVAVPYAQLCEIEHLDADEHK